MNQTKYRNAGNYKSVMETDNIDVAVPNALTSIAVIQTFGFKRIYVQIKVAGNALSAFKISAKATSNATIEPSVLYSTASDFVAPAGLIIGTSGDLTSQPVGLGWLIMDVEGLNEVTLEAISASAAGSVVSVFVGGV